MICTQLFRRARRTGTNLVVAAALVLIVGAMFAWVMADRAMAQQARGEGGKSALLFLGNESLPPMNFIKDGIPTGVVVDLAEAIAKRMNRPVEIQLINWAKAQQLVTDGRADALLQINPSPERQKIYDFSEPLLTSEFAIFTSAERSGITSTHDLRGMKVGVEENGLPNLLLKEDPQITVKVIPDFVQGFRMLGTGSLDAVVVDRWVGRYVLAENNIKGVKLFDQPIGQSHSAIAVRKGNKEVLADINAALTAIRQDGTYDKIINSWQPKEVVFKTREQLHRQLRLIVAFAAALVLALACVAVLVREIRRRKRVEATLRESRARLDLALQSASMGAWHWDLVENRRVFDDRACRLLGIDPVTFTGTADEFFGAVHPDDREMLKAALARTIEQDVPYEPEYRAVWPDGSVHYIAARGRMARHDVGNKPERINGVIWDITDRKRMEEELRDSEHKLRLFIEHAPAAVAMFDRAMKYIAVSRRWLADYGLADEKIIGRSHYEIFPEIPERWKEIHRRCLEGATEKASEDAFPRMDGSTDWVSWEVLPWYEHDGDIGGIIILSEVVTARKEAEDRLRVSEEKFAKAFAMNPSAIVMSRLEDGLILEANETWLAMFGYRRDEVIGRSSVSLQIWPTPEVRSRRIKELREKGFLHGVEETMLRRSGELFVTLASAEILTVAGEEVALSTWLDISDRKRAEEALKKAHAELELRVQERTAELRSAYQTLQAETDERKRLEEQLRQAQKMEALGTLTGGIAHDFNNILAAILGFAEMSLDEAPQGSLLEKNLQYILNSSFRARDLIRQMLTFSRKTEYEVKPIPLTPLVKETAKLLRASIPSTVQIDVSSTASSDTILANATGVQQIIMNLSANAAYAMQEKGGRLNITLADANVEPDRGLPPGDYLEVAVQDTGAGMNAEVMKRIFEPFFTTKDVGQGTGMGLAVVYGIVKSLKGDISVQSKPGQGSTFKVLIPKAKTDSKPGTAQAPAIAGGKENILFVDDEEIITELGKGMLERLGYRVTALTDSAEALKLFSEHPTLFDLVITDQTMPAYTGLRLAEQLLKLRPDLPIILCTGHSDSVNPESAKAAGITDFLMKPLARQELAEAVRKALDGVKR